MEFLDSLDSNVATKRSRRVRSWYLYEQFRSLERHQLDAAQKLKDRSYQDKVLRKELSERRARRKLYDQYGLQTSDYKLESMDSDGKTCISSSNDDFYESFCELHAEETMPQDSEHDLSDDSSQNDLRTNLYEEEFKSVEPHNGTEVGNVRSLVNLKSEMTITDDIQRAIDFAHVEADIDYEATAAMRCPVNLDQEQKRQEEESLYSFEEKELKPTLVMKDKNVYTNDNNIFAMWTKLVSFAYQIIQLNHGNCYYDYGYQFLTAVLACDVLRKGINKMCDILQPYVTPIKFTTDSDTSATIFKSENRQKYNPLQRQAKFYKKLSPCNFTKQYPKKYHLENSWQHCSERSAENKMKERMDSRASEPWSAFQKILVNLENSSSRSSCGIWPKFSNETLYSNHKKIGKCGCGCSAISSMLKLTEYIDNILKEIDDSKII